MKLTLFLAALVLPLSGMSQLSDSKIEAVGARELNAIVPQHLGRMFTEVKNAYIKGDGAVVSANLLDRKCTLLLVRKPGTQTDWLVDKVDCQK